MVNSKGGELAVNLKSSSHANSITNPFVPNYVTGMTKKLVWSVYAEYVT